MSSIRFILTNLTRRRLRSVVTALGVSVAVAALFSMASFQSGYQRGLRNELDRLGADVLVVPKGCPYDAASIALHGASWPCYLKSSYLASVRSTPHVAVAAPVFMNAVYEARTGAQFVYCGVDQDILKVKRTWRITGAFPAHANDLLVGSEIARSRRWGLGSSVSLPGLTGERGRVSGILAPTDGPDDMFVYMRLGDAQTVFHRPGHLTHMLVRLDRPEDMDFVVHHLRGCDAGLDMNVVPLAHLFQTITNLVQSTRLLLGAVALVALLAAAAGVSNTILMAVAERTREIGVLRAVGASRARVFGLVLGETVVLCVAGGLAGVLLAIAGAGGIEGWIRGRLPFTPHGALMRVDPVVVAVCLAGAAIVGAAAGLLPAGRAAGFSPARAIRAEG